MTFHLSESEEELDIGQPLDIASPLARASDSLGMRFVADALLAPTDTPCVHGTSCKRPREEFALSSSEEEDEMDDLFTDGLVGDEGTHSAELADLDQESASGGDEVENIEKEIQTPSKLATVVSVEGLNDKVFQPEPEPQTCGAQRPYATGPPLRGSRPAEIDYWVEPLSRYLALEGVDNLNLIPNRTVLMEELCAGMLTGYHVVQVGKLEYQKKQPSERLFWVLFFR